jgi:hypothetical protein
VKIEVWGKLSTVIGGGKHKQGWNVVYEQLRIILQFPVTFIYVGETIMKKQYERKYIKQCAKLPVEAYNCPSWDKSL